MAPNLFCFFFFFRFGFFIFDLLFCPFSLQFAAFWSWKRIATFWSSKFEPIIFRGICNMLVLIFFILVFCDDGSFEVCL